MPLSASRIANSSPPQRKAGVGDAHGFQQSLGAIRQRAVAGQVPEAVVDRLEAVEVEQDQAEPPALAATTGQLDPERLAEGAPVAEPGQIVGPGFGEQVESHLALGPQNGPDDEGEQAGEGALQRDLADLQGGGALVGEWSGQSNDARPEQGRRPPRWMNRRGQNACHQVEQVVGRVVAAGQPSDDGHLGDGHVRAHQQAVEADPRTATHEQVGAGVGDRVGAQRDVPAGLADRLGRRRDEHEHEAHHAAEGPAHSANPPAGLEVHALVGVRPPSKQIAQVRQAQVAGPAVHPSCIGSWGLGFRFNASSTVAAASTRPNFISMFRSVAR